MDVILLAGQVGVVERHRRRALRRTLLDVALRGGLLEPVDAGSTDLAAALPALRAGPEGRRDEIGAAVVAVDLALTADGKVIPNSSKAEGLRVVVVADSTVVGEQEEVTWNGGMSASMLSIFMMAGRL